MTDETLNKANELKEEIGKLEHFIYYATLTWKQLSILEKMKNKKVRLHYKGYGCFNGGDYDLSKELSEKVLVVLEQHLEELKEQYKTLS